MEATAQTTSPALAISNGIVHITREYTGRGPTKARTHIAADHVTVILGDVLTKAERRLVESGNTARVLDLRRDFQALMRDELVATVEAELQREVIAFLSASHLDPDLAVLTFILRPVQ